MVKLYPEAEKLIIVLDNLNTHAVKWFFETFTKERVEEILEKVEFHNTPVHRSWLNMAEIEISVLETEYLNRRIPDRMTIQKEVTAWNKRGNNKKAKINWQFTRKKAREKFNLPVDQN